MRLLSLSLLSLLASRPAAAGYREADPAAIERALRGALADKDLAARASALLSEQVRAQPPLGMADGAWIVPLDTAVLLEDEALGRAVEYELAAEELALPDVLEASLGLAFVPADLVAELGVDWDTVGYQDLAEGIRQEKATDIWWWVAAGVVAGGAIVVDLIIRDAASDSAENAGYWAGRTDQQKMNDPKLDSDNDGSNNYDDPDDDNDGVSDGGDRYPFDDKRSICDLCGSGSIPGLVEPVEGTFFLVGEDADVFTELTLIAIAEIAAVGQDGAVMYLEAP